MKKTKISGIIGIALILSAVLLIALTAFFGVFDANRKVNEFVDTLPGNEENIETPLPDEPETTLPDTPDTPVTPDVTPSEPPTVAEAAKAISQRLPSTVSNAGTYGFPNNCWTSYNKDSDGNDCGKCNPSYGNSASNLQGSGISATYTYVTFKNTHDRWIGSQDRYATFKGSFTVNLSGKALNYARAGLLNCTFGLEQKWSGGGLNQSYTFKVGSKSVSTNSSGEPVSLNTSSIDVAAVSSSSSSFTVSFSATMGAKKNGNVSIGYDFWIQISFDKDTTKPNAYIYASNSDGFSTVDPGSNYFRATDNAAGIKSVKCTFTPFGSSAKTSTKTINSDSLNAYYTIKYFFPSESNYFGTYTFSVTDKDNNTSSSATVKYYKAAVSFNADTGGSVSEASAATNLAVGATYNVSAKVTPNEGYYFIGWDAAGDGSPLDLGVGSYSNGKWSNGSFNVKAPSGSVTGNITYTAKFRKISDISWFSYTPNNSFVYAYNTSRTNLSSYLNETDDFVGNAFTVSLTYTGTTDGENNYNSSDQPKYAGKYRAVITVSKDSVKFAVIEANEFEITAKPVYLVPNLSSSSKDYDGSTDIPIGSWAIYDDAALKTAVNSDGLTVPGTTGVNIRLSSKDAGTQNIDSLVNSEKVTISHTNKDILNSYSATVVTGRAKFENNIITTYTINKLTVKITNMVIREKTSANASKVYTGKVYDRTTALGADVVAFVYTSSDGATEFNSLAQYGAGTIGIGIKFDTNDLTKVPDGENLSVQLVQNQSSVPETDNTVYFTAPSFTGSAVGTELKVGLPTNIYNTSGNYMMSSTADRVGDLIITEKPVSVSFSLNTTLTYDGSATVSGNELTARLNGIIDGDNVAVSGYTGTLNDMNAGDGRTITVSGYSLSNDNYVLSNTTYQITGITVAKRDVSVSAAYANPSKVYDGTTAALKENVSLSYSNNVSGEDGNNGVDKIITGFSVQYSSAIAGDVYIIITVTPHSNYIITATEYRIAATITAKPLSASGIVLALDKTSFVYSGDPYTPELDTHTDVLGDGSTYTLVSGTDYSVSISPATAVGNYSAVVTGKGNYTGSKTLQYEVTAGDYTISLDKAATITLPYGEDLGGFDSYFIGKAEENQHKNAVSGSWTLDANGITYNKDGLDIYAAGNHTIYAVFTVADKIKNNFKVSTKKVEVVLTVNKANVKITVDPMEYYYAGVYDLNFGSEYVEDRNTGLGSWGDHYTVSGVLSGDEENLYGLTFGFAESDGFVPKNETLNDARKYVGAITLTEYSSPNYVVTVVRGDVTIKPLPVTLTPVSGQSKYYGTADPVLQYTLSTLERTLPGYTLNGNGEIKGSLLRTSGESAGYYNFDGSGLSSVNYDLDVSDNKLISFRIMPLPITIVPGNTEIYFGATFVSPSVDNGFSFTAEIDPAYASDVEQSGNTLVSKIAGTNTLTISFRTSAAQGSAAGEYSVRVERCSSADENGGKNNFTFDLSAEGVYTVKPLPVQITANAVRKQFADVDPATAYYTATVLNGIQTDESFNLATALKGNLARDPGENVGTYAWNIGTLTEEANPSFEITYDLSSAKFTVYRREIALQVSKINGIVYGESIPAILGEKGAGDGINSGEWSLAPGNTYYGAGFNTALYPDLDFTIVGGLKIVLTEGDFDPDGFLSTKRDEDDNAIGYDLAADSVLAEYLSADSDKNYFVTRIDGLSKAFFVEPVKAVVYIDPTKSATFTFGTSVADINTALKGMYLIKDNRSDSLPLDLKEFTGFPVLDTTDDEAFKGTYPTVGEYIMDVSNIEHIDDSYDVELLPDQFITVTAKTLTVTVTGGNTHEYGATKDSVIEYSLTGVVDGYPVTGAALSRDGASGTFSEKMNAGSYVITYGTLTNDRFPNYNFVFGATYYYTITPRTITVVPVAASSVYGDPEKVISYQTYYNYGTENQSAGLLNSDRLGGSLQRANASVTDAGDYEIEHGTLNLAGVNGYNPNYKVTVESGVYYTIKRKAITVFADTASSHAFGLTFYDPAVKGHRLDITISSAGNFDVGLLNGSADIEISSEQYSAANKVMLPGSYRIVQGTLTNENNPNFDITFVPRTPYYVVAKATVTYYVNSVEFNYGQFEYDGNNLLENPAFASAVYVGGLVQSGVGNEYFGDFTGDISLYLQNADTGRLNAGNYGYSYEYLGTSYLPGQSFETEYYVVNISGANNALNVNAAPVTVSVQLDGETLSENGNVFNYNAAERVISLTYNGVIDGDDFAAQETVTVAFENAAAYAVTNSISAVGKYVVSVYVITDERNYYISGKGASSFNTLDINIEIAKAELSVSVDALPETSFEKVYGSADPDFIAAVPGVGGESVTIAFVRKPGESVGEYSFVSVNVGTEFAENYNAVLIKSEKAFAVTPAQISVDPDVLLANRLTKTYGDADPDFSAYADGVNGESVAVTFVRTSGENAGEYTIASVTTENGNYTVTVTAAATFTVTPKAATVTADNKSAIYDGNDFSKTYSGLTYTVDGFINDDAPVGALAIVSPAVNAGEYTIYAETAFENDNYEITFVPGTFTIERRQITVTSSPMSGVEFLFDPALECFFAADSFVYTVENIVDGEVLNGSLGDLRMQAGYGIAIPQGTLTDENNPNYTITYIAGTIDVDKITLLITPTAASSVYGEADTVIEYSVVREDGKALPENFSLNGALSYAKISRTAFADVGNYVVTLGNLSEENPDYIIEFAEGAENIVYTVVQRPVTLTIDDAETVYGEALKELTMVIGGMGLATGETDFAVTLQKSDPDNRDVDEYVIYLKEGYADDNPNYAITVNEGKYTIVPRPITVHLLDQAADWNKDGIYTVDQKAYDVIKGNVVSGDNLGIVISSEIGKQKRKYPITAVSTNRNYAVTFNDDATFEVRKFRADIEVPSLTLEFIYSGEAFSIAATLNSGAEIVYTWEFGGTIYHDNAFVEVGRYVVTLSAGETEDYYAPENVTVNLTIKRETLITEESGIEIVVDSESGFNPEVELEVEKMDQNDKDLNEVISGNETIVRAFNITTSDESSDETTTITVRVPEALKDLETVKVLVKQDGVYSVRMLNVDNGYVTIESAESVSAFAFVKEEASVNYLMIILIGGAALIIIVSTVMFMLKKRG